MFPNDKFAFISRHQPTDRQRAMAAAVNIDLVYVGDRDAFTVEPSDFIGHAQGPFDGVVVVHPAAAMRLGGDFLIGVFKNANRAGPNEPPTFEAVDFIVFDSRD